MSGWIAQHFLHPSFVLPWGIALAALPVIIHLINRLRYRRVRFAAMKFLLKSQQRNRRRLLIEQLLLLLLRVAIVMAILVLISRLVLDPSALWVFRGAKAHHVVLLDDSGSMRDRWGETSAFREGVSTVKRLVAEGVRRPGTVQCTLILLSHPEHPVFLKRDVDTAFAAELENVFEHLECTHQALELETGVMATAKLLSLDAGSIRQLHVISDFRAIDWSERPALRAAFVAVSKTGASIDLARTVAEPHDNLAITNLSGEVRTAAAGVPVRLTATVRNFGSRVADHVRLSVLADGHLLPLTGEIERLNANQELHREIDVTFPKPGKHTLEVQLPEDSLAADNHRFVAIDVNVANPVLIIDGNPEGEDASYISLALAPDSTLTGFSTRPESPDFLRRQPLDSYRCIYLLNCPQLPEDAVAPLAEYVRAGGGLVWYLGDVVKKSTSFYNDVLYKAQGGLFPVRLADKSKTLIRDPDSHAPDLTFAKHPIFHVFHLADNPFSESVRINEWIPVAEDWVRDDNARKDSVSTIAFLPGKEPFAFERKFGKGRIVAFLSTAGPKWNNWGPNPSFVVLHLELAKYIARDDQVLEPRLVGQPIQVAFNPAEYLETVEVTSPDAIARRLKATRAATDERAAKEAESRARGPKTDANAPSKSPTSTPRAQSKGAADSIRVTATYTETDRPGLYVVRLYKDQTSSSHEQWLAYNVPMSESDLRTATTAEILARLSGDVHVNIHEPGTLHWTEGTSPTQEARTLWLALLAAALVIEQFFAHRLGYHPQMAKEAA